MPALPKWFKPLFVLLFSFFLFQFSILNSYAANPPNPQPCKNPIETEQGQLTDNYITDDNGEAPYQFDVTVSGSPGEIKQLPPITFNFDVDFSKLQALFAKSNSDFPEGRVQDNDHRFENIQDLNTQDFNLYHGAIQKLSWKTLLDTQKKNYIEYVYEKPTLPEANNKYTDVEGSGDPKTVYELVNQFGLPNPPSSSKEKQAWLETWGKYWEKIPTTWSEFYTGALEFRYALGEKQYEGIKNGQCPVPFQKINFVMPEFYRTTAIADQMNRMLMAREVQSYREHKILAETQNDSNVITKVIRLCWDKIKNSTLSLKKVVQISFDLANPIKDVSAQEENPSCIRDISEGKEGSAPYCPLGQEEYSRLRSVGILKSCDNKNDPNKLDQSNPNVICHFTITWPAPNPYNDPTVPDNDFNKLTIDPQSPTCSPNADGTYICGGKLRIWPDFRIPWLTAIWNDTLYSEEEQGQPGVFGAFTPLTLRPSNLTPQEILDLCERTNGEDPLCQKLGTEFDICVENEIKNGRPSLEAWAYCLGTTLDLPANTQNVGENDPRERFMGAVQEPGKNHVKDCALMFRAVKEKLGIKTDC